MQTKSVEHTIQFKSKNSELDVRGPISAGGIKRGVERCGGVWRECGEQWQGRR